MNLRFKCFTAHDRGQTGYPQQVMKALGITYLVATPQSICDQWWFWGCKNVPEVLPPYLTELGIKPHSEWSRLTRSEADQISAAEAEELASAIQAS